MTTLSIITESKKAIQKKANKLQVNMGVISNKTLKIFLKLLKSKLEKLTDIELGFSPLSFNEDRNLFNQIDPFIKKDSRLRLFTSYSEFFRFFDLMINLGFLDFSELDYHYEDNKLKIPEEPNQIGDNINFAGNLEKEKEKKRLEDMEHIRSLVRQSQQGVAELDFKLNNLRF